MAITSDEYRELIDLMMDDVTEHARANAFRETPIRMGGPGPRVRDWFAERDDAFHFKGWQKGKLEHAYDH